MRKARQDDGNRRQLLDASIRHPQDAGLHQRIKHVRGFSIILRIMPTHQNQWFVRHVLPPSNYPANVEHRPPSRSPQGQKLFVLPTKCQNGQNTNMRQLCPHAMPKLTSLFFYIFLETASECTAKSIISARVSQSGCPSVLISFTRMFRLRLVWGYLLLFETC
jgi:hypothetical protein